MSDSKYILLAKDEPVDDYEEDSTVIRIRQPSKHKKLRSTFRDFLLILIGFICAFGILKTMNWNEIEDNFYHDVLEEFQNDKLNYNSHDSNESLAHMLFKEVKILCLVTTTPENHLKRAVHVKKTWGKRCNKLIFASTEQDTQLGAIKLDVKPNRNGLWDKTKESLKYVYNHHLENFDWFLKADDDTFVILENLRYFLYSYSPDFPIAFGCKLHLEDDDSYFSGGAGYVLSRKAVSEIVEKGLKDPKICNPKSAEDEDVEMGFCLKKLHIMAGDSRDEQKRGMFHPLSPASTLLPVAKIDDWYPEAIYYKFQLGLNCCSDYSISFHYIKPKELYALEYLLYHMRKPFGIPTSKEELPKKYSWKEVEERNKVDLIEMTD